MVTHQSAIVNKFCKGNKEKMGAYRFLNNPAVTAKAILSGMTSACSTNASGKPHVL